MSFWENFKRTSAAERLLEERLYERVMQELESGQRRDGLWLKAIENSLGDEKRTEALYIRYRVQSIKDEAHLPVEPHPERASLAYSPVNAHDAAGLTPLMKAVKAVNVLEVLSLLSRGASPAIKDGNFGTTTALDMALLAYRRAPAASEERAVLGDIVDALGGNAGDI